MLGGASRLSFTMTCVRIGRITLQPSPVTLISQSRGDEEDEGD